MDYGECDTCGMDLGSTFYADSFVTFDFHQWGNDNEVTKYRVANDESLADPYYDYSADAYVFVGGQTINWITDNVISSGPTPSHTICCGKLSHMCKCAERISFSDAISKIKNHVMIGEETPKDYAYNDQYTLPDDLNYTLCGSCDNMGTFRCQKYRNWLYDVYLQLDYLDLGLVEGGSLADLRVIDPCHDYSPSASATADDIDLITMFLNNQERANDDDGPSIIILEEADDDLYGDYGYFNYY